MVDSGSVISLVTKKTAKEIEVTNGNAWLRHTTNRRELQINNNSCIQNLSTCYCEVESFGCNGYRVDLIAIPNNHRALIGRDLLESLELTLSQQDGISDKNSGKQILPINSKSCLRKLAIAQRFQN